MGGAVANSVISAELHRMSLHCPTDTSGISDSTPPTAVANSWTVFSRSCPEFEVGVEVVVPFEIFKAFASTSMRLMYCVLIRTKV